MTGFTIGSPETRVFILVAPACVNVSHWFNIMSLLTTLKQLPAKFNILDHTPNPVKCTTHHNKKTLSINLPLLLKT